MCEQARVELVDVGVERLGQVGERRVCAVGEPHRLQTILRGDRRTELEIGARETARQYQVLQRIRMQRPTCVMSRI